MADREIALDVGTSAVRAVELRAGGRRGGRAGGGPELRRWGQVTLPPGAVMDGEVIDVPAVADTLARLWSDVGFPTRNVRLGLGSTRLIVRTVELPALSRHDARSALRFQLADLVPFPPDETVFDAVPLDPPGLPGVGRADHEDRVLLVAAHAGVVEPLVTAAGRAGLKVTAIDAAVLALARLLVAPPAGGVSLSAADEPRADAVLDVGASTVHLVVAHDGQPTFARTVAGVGGEAVTARLAADPDLEVRAVAAVLDELAAELEDSLTFFASQPDAVAVERLFVTGGGSRLAGLTDGLQQRLGLPVVAADPLRVIHAHRLAGDPVALADAAPHLAVALGVALPGGVGPRIDLRAETLRSSGRKAPYVLGGVAAVLLLGGIGVHRQREADIRRDVTAREVAAQQLAEVVAAATPASAVPGAALSEEQIRLALTAALGADVDWWSVLGELEQLSTPLGVDVTNVQGTAPTPSNAAPTTASASPATTVPASPGTGTTVAAASSLAIAATAPGVPTVAAWLDALAASARFHGAWVSSTTRVSGTGGVQFTATVELTAADTLARPLLEREEVLG